MSQRLIYIVVPAMVEVPEHFDLEEVTKKVTDHVYGTVLPVCEAETIDPDYYSTGFRHLSHEHNSNDYENCAYCIEASRNGEHA